MPELTPGPTHAELLVTYCRSAEADAFILRNTTFTQREIEDFSPDAYATVLLAMDFDPQRPWKDRPSAGHADGAGVPGKLQGKLLQLFPRNQG